MGYIADLIRHAGPPATACKFEMDFKPKENLSSSVPADSEDYAWNRWLDCVYTSGITASEFLERWRQACKEAQVSADKPIQEVYQYRQFLRAVRHHPAMKSWTPDVDLAIESPNLMERVYKKFLASSQKEVVVFVARASPFQRNECLQQSLQQTKRLYEQHYGTIESECRFFTFTQDPNKPFLYTSELSSYFTDIKKYDGKLTLVTNGWNGLTTDRMSFFILFSHWADRITLRVYSEEDHNAPQKFVEVNIPDVCKVFKGEKHFDPEGADDGGLSKSTAQFIRKFSAINHFGNFDTSDEKTFVSAEGKVLYPMVERGLFSYIWRSRLN